MKEKKRILCYGDSLTWGWIPRENGQPTTRYPQDERWPGAMLSALGDDFDIVEEGLSGRTTSIDDPIDSRLNGNTHLPTILATHLPLEFVVIMLGTNDTKACFRRSAFDIAMGMSGLLAQIARSTGGVGTSYPAPKPILVAPPPLSTIMHPWPQAKFEGAEAKTVEVARLYSAMADYTGIEFINAGDIISTDGIDGIHLTAQNNIDLGQAIAEKVKLIACYKH